MAKGASSKEIVIKKILETFEGAFLADKELRIPLVEDNEPIQIKVALTCAKTNIDNPNESTSSLTIPQPEQPKKSMATEPSAEEKQNVSDLLARLGLS